jgi:hypothetical protein
MTVAPDVPSLVLRDSVARLAQAKAVAPTAMSSTAPALLAARLTDTGDQATAG